MFVSDRTHSLSPVVDASFNSMIASAVLAAVCAVAFSVLFGCYPLMAERLSSIVLWGGIGGFSTVVLIASSATHLYFKHKLKHIDVPLQDIPISVITTTRSSTVEIEEQNSGKQEEVVSTEASSPPTSIPLSSFTQSTNADQIMSENIDPIFDELGTMISALVTTHRHFQNKPSTDVDFAVQEAIGEAKQLLNGYLHKPRLSLEDLLCFFGRGKTKPTAGLRRLISAFNSGDAQIYTRVKGEFDAIIRGNDLQEVRNLLQTDNADMLGFREAIEQHFSLDEKELERIGKELLKAIFASPRTENQKVIQAWTALRNTARSSKPMEIFATEVEKFLKTAFAEANIEENTLNTLHETLIAHMIQDRFFQILRLILGIFAQNIRHSSAILNSNKKTLLSELSCALRMSEISDCMGSTQELQTALIREQVRINSSRKEHMRIAFIRTDTTLDHQALINLCTQRNPRSPPVNQTLAQRLNFSIAVVPITVSDPFKEISSLLNVPFLVSAGSAIALRFKNTILKWVLTHMHQTLPIADAEASRQIDHLITLLATLLLEPAYEASVRPGGAFGVHLRAVLRDKGPAFADKLAVLSMKNFTYEELNTVCIEGFKSLAQSFRTDGT